MPRLTSQQYIAAHNHLRLVWPNRNSMYRYLSAKMQWELHDYFAPSRNLSEEELLAHRRRVSEARPSLPQRAGRAFRNFARVIQQSHVAVAAAPASSKRQKVTAVRVSSVVRPEIDYQRVIGVLLEMTEDSAVSTRPRTDGDTGKH